MNEIEIEPPLYAEFPDQHAPIDDILPNDKPDPYELKPEPSPADKFHADIAAASHACRWGS